MFQFQYQMVVRPFSPDRKLLSIISVVPFMGVAGDRFDADE